MDEKKGYKKLKIWGKAHQLAMEIYNISKKFPKEEMYGLTSQIRRAGFSVSLNIVEGHASNSRKEFLSFLNIANRSLVETEYLLEVVKELNFINDTEYGRLEEMRIEAAVMLNAFTKAIRTKMSEIQRVRVS
ncbi:MAG: four helix bundle protein [Nitrospirota bacterium]